MNDDDVDPGTRDDDASLGAHDVDPAEVAHADELLNFITAIQPFPGVFIHLCHSHLFLNTVLKVPEGVINYV